MNDAEMEEEAFIDFLRTKKIPYNITEYLENNRDLSEFYKDTTFTIRIMVINDKITSPQIANAYLRIATKKTGNTDNIGSGGVCAQNKFGNGGNIRARKDKKSHHNAVSRSSRHGSHY